MAYIAGPDRTQAVLLPDVLDDYVRRLERAGFREIAVDRHPETAARMIEYSGAPPVPGAENLLSVNVLAYK